ncbi:MAG: hypothetical protein EB101_11575 [Chitinophagia bacterium]|nr:hypothetical protein [Chitinophagia bacterium]
MHTMGETVDLATLLAIVERIESKIDALHLEVNKSMRPNRSDLRKLHYETYRKILHQAYEYNGHLHCPCCNKQTTDNEWHVDHWSTYSGVQRQNGWLICSECNYKLLAPGSLIRSQYAMAFTQFHAIGDMLERLEASR